MLMSPEWLALLAGLIFLAALLYSTVGHGGASGYLAVMALLGVAPLMMKPTALTLNVLVAAIGCWRFIGAGHFNLRLFLPLVLASVPAAFVGGLLTLPTLWYQPLVGAVLLYAGAQSLRRRHDTDIISQPFHPLGAIMAGAVIGLLSGLTGVGGGIFLTPLLLWLGWAPMRTVAGISAAFILLNSLAGLAGLLSTGATLPPALPWLALAALAGALIGTELGSRRLSLPWLRQLLSLILIIAGLKLVMTA